MSGSRAMSCRPGCAACCEAISISSPMPGMPQGKPAGVICRHLERESRLCTLWGLKSYPEVCRRFSPDPQYCGEAREAALRRLQELEQQTRPEA